MTQQHNSTGDPSLFSPSRALDIVVSSAGEDDILYRDSAMGSSSFLAFPVVSVSTSADSHQHVQCDCMCTSQDHPFTSMVDFLGHEEGDIVQGASVSSDTSLFRWGAHLQTQLTQVRWSRDELENSWSSGPPTWASVVSNNKFPAIMFCC